MPPGITNFGNGALAYITGRPSRHRGHHAEEHQEKREVQELRRQGPDQERRQENEMPALRRNRVQVVEHVATSLSCPAKAGHPVIMVSRLMDRSAQFDWRSRPI